MIEIVEHGSGITELRMAKPPVNALSPPLLQAIRAGLGEAVEAGARAVVLSGRSGMFSAGLDVPYLLQRDRAGIEAAWKDFLDAVEALARSPIPVIAAITGHSPAGGAVLSLACDYRIMAQGDYTIGLNEVRVGIPMPPFIFSLARLALGQRSAEIACSTGQLYAPEEALAVGFIDQIMEADQVVEAAVEHCGRLQKLPPDTYLRSRQTVRRDLHAIFDQLQAADVDALTEAWFSNETQATLRGLVERLQAANS